MILNNFKTILLIILSFSAHSIFAFGSGQIGPINNHPLHWVTTDSSVVIRIINLFEPAYSNTWGPDFTLGEFDRAGDYISPFVRPFLDSIRGNTAELNFPSNRFRGKRGFACYIPPDLNIKRISFFAKHLSGPTYIPLTIFEWRNKAGLRYTCSIQLKNNWEFYNIPLEKFICIERPGLTPNLANQSTWSLIFTSDNRESVILLDDLLGEGHVKGNISIFRPPNGEWAFTEGAPATPKYFISTGYKKKLVIQAIAKDESGHSALDSVTLTLNGITTKSLNFRNLPSGYYTVSISALENGKIVYSNSEIDHFVVVANKTSGETSPIGVCMNALTYSEENFLSLVRSGITLGRVPNFHWQDIEPLPGQVSFAFLDYITQCANKANFRLMPITGYAPSWSINPPKVAPPWRGEYLLNSPPANTNLLASRTAQIMGRYSRYITLWEFWNEPNFNRGPPYYFFGTTKEYLTLFKKTLNECRETAPGCTLISGGISHNKNVDPNFTTEMVKDSTIALKAYGFHAYGLPVLSWNEIAKVKERIPQIKLFMTEVGEMVDDSDESAVRSWSVMLFQQTFEFLSKGVEQWVIHWFNPNMDHHKKRCSQLLFFDGSPNKRMASICVLASMTMGMKSIKEQLYNSRLKIYCVTTPRVQRLILIGKGAISVTCKGNLTRIDLSGRRSDVILKDSKVQIVQDRDDVVFYECNSFTEIHPVQSDFSD